ncbi:ribokinase [Flavivirga spongiicola]|uniref:Ribokinase n=1 Tax=Flavivirga spongiicola TaxID=421621 RepID=A0ABU7XRR0_9FLAO|nr:ribokinase [Flavivirga sp. MEBiC05379]MDO5977522.1 ribokinase [Flavivirga sp. MEBiC05379]
MKKIVILGSSNTDLITKVKKFPAPGETIVGKEYMEAMGGKGANQAMAAHRLGANVQFITCMGGDENGKNALAYYKKEGLDVSSSLIVNEVASGTAIIMVDEHGENSIIITPGANNKLDPTYLLSIENIIKEADILVLQMETPYETVKKACALAKKNQTQVILNVAPAMPIDNAFLNNVDILVVNETEAETLSGGKIENIGEEAVVNILLDKGVKAVVLTLGKNGCFYKNREERMSLGAFEVDAVDTTAAGDTFCGALAAEIARGNSWENSLIFASAASAICITKMGAQPSIPKEDEVRAFLSKNKLSIQNEIK